MEQLYKAYTQAVLAGEGYKARITVSHLRENAGVRELAERLLEAEDVLVGDMLGFTKEGRVLLDGTLVDDIKTIANALPPRLPRDVRAVAARIQVVPV